MFELRDTAERHGRILAELSELGLSLARDLQQRALAAETPEAAASLANAFHRISRSVRQTLALEAKLTPEHQRRVQEADAIEEIRQRPIRAEQRRTEVRTAVERLIWAEAEGQEAEDLLADLDDYLAWDVTSETFLTEPLDAYIERLCEDLDMKCARAGIEDRVNTPTSAPQCDDPYQSSA